LQEGKCLPEFAQHSVRADVGNGASVALISNSQQCAPFGIVCPTEFMPQRFIKGRREQLALDQWSAARDAS
jgi:hypothetical protein